MTIVSDYGDAILASLTEDQNETLHQLVWALELGSPGETYSFLEEDQDNDRSVVSAVQMVDLGTFDTLAARFLVDRIPVPLYGRYSDDTEPLTAEDEDLLRDMAILAEDLRAKVAEVEEPLRERLSAYLVNSHTH